MLESIIFPSYESLISHAFPGSARTNAMSIVKHALGPATHKSMVVEVKSSPAFSLMMDESTDRGVNNHVGKGIAHSDNE